MGNWGVGSPEIMGHKNGFPEYVRMPNFAIWNLKGGRVWHQPE